MTTHNVPPSCARDRRAALVMLLLAACGVARGQSIDYARSFAAELDSRVSTLAAEPASPTIGGYMLFRYVLNARDDATLTNELTNGFQDSKIKLSASGQVSDEFGYSILLSVRLSDGGIELQDAVGTYKPGENWTVRWGQFKLPLLREEMIADTTQLAADRSAMNSAFTQGRSQGVEARYRADDWRCMAAASDGLGTANSDFTSGAEADYAFTGRFEYRGAGEWTRFDDFTSWRGGDTAWMIGGAGHWQSGGDTNGTPDTDVFTVTADGSLEGDGWTAFAQFVYRMAEPAAGSDTDDMGLLVQGGYFVTDTCEVFARWDSVFPDDNGPGAPEDFNTITAGVNCYVIPHSHAAKITVDFQYFVDEQAASIVPVNTLTGLLASGEDGQWVVRCQAQVKF